MSRFDERTEVERKLSAVKQTMFSSKVENTSSPITEMQKKNKLKIFLPSHQTVEWGDCDSFKVVDSHAPITRTIFRSKQNVLTSVTCYKSRRLSWLESAENAIPSACFSNYFEKDRYPRRVFKRQTKLITWLHVSDEKITLVLNE